MPIGWSQAFDAGVEYEAFLERYGTLEQRRRWEDTRATVDLSDTQRSLLAGFSRDMNVACLAGMWCGDCARQCPIFQRFAAASPRIHLRFLDRDAHPQLAAELRVCGGGRVPVVVFLSEDFHECARYGDRTLSTYRRLAVELGGAACPTGLGGAGEETAEIAGEWLREFERVQLMLRLSPRLRQKHGD